MAIRRQSTTDARRGRQIYKKPHSGSENHLKPKQDVFYISIDAWKAGTRKTIWASR